MRNSSDLPLLDAIVIGGGPAGLQAALTLGRMHFDTVLFDSGEYRNSTVEHAHNLVTNDGRSPAELRRIARTELETYATVSVRDAAVRDVSPTPLTGGETETSFTVTAADGSVVHTRAVLLATGMSDTLPDVPGLAEHWGGRVAQCPFCHGHELAGQPIAVVGEGAHVDAVRGMLARISDEITTMAPTDLARVSETGADAGLELALNDGSTRRVGGVFIAAAARQRSPIAEQLGCAMLESGAVEIDAMGCTSVAGVYAAGDMAHSAALPGPMVSLAAAIASGQLAAVSAVRASLVT